MPFTVVVQAHRHFVRQHATEAGVIVGRRDDAAVDVLPKIVLGGDGAVVDLGGEPRGISKLSRIDPGFGQGQGLGVVARQGDLDRLDRRRVGVRLAQEDGHVELVAIRGVGGELEIVRGETVDVSVTVTLLILV